MAKIVLDQSKLIAGDEQLLFLNSLEREFDFPDQAIRAAERSLQAMQLGLHEISLRIAYQGMRHSQKYQLQGLESLFGGIIASAIEHVNHYNDLDLEINGS